MRIGTEVLPFRLHENDLAPQKSGLLDKVTRPSIHAMMHIFFDVLYRCKEGTTCFGSSKTIDQITSLIVEDQRPKLDAELPWLYRYLLYSGWQPDAHDRPDSSEVFAILQRAHSYMDSLKQWILCLPRFQKTAYPFHQCPTVADLLGCGF